MKKLFYATAFILIALSVFWNMPTFAAGAGGSWGESTDGYSGGGGSFGGSSGGGSWGNSDGFGGNGGSSSSGSSLVCTVKGVTYSDPDAACVAAVGRATGWWGQTVYSYTKRTCVGSNAPDNVLGGVTCSEVSPPECPSGQVYNGSQCVPELQCPAGYKKEGGQCVWQCPAGFKELGGSCVPDDQPEDCDPAIQECNEDGTPKCDPCSKLQQLINNNLTMINNDNRVISLTETMTANQNITNNNLNNVNNNLNVINNNMSIVNNNIKNINESVNNVITAIENNKPDFDTTALENKIDEVITAITNNTSGGGGSGEATDLTALLEKLDEMHQSIIDNKYDDAELKAKIDELINKDLSEITDRQDEQIGLLEDIKRLLMPTNEAGDPDYGIPDVDEFNAHLDPWSAIRGFDVNQNMINAQAQCPSGDAYSFTFLGKTFAMPMQILCGYLGQIGVGIMFLAYISGAFIIVKGD